MIITEYHIALYKRIGGDVDHLQRIGTAQEKSLENQKNIIEMRNIITDLELIKKEITSERYADKIMKNISELCANETVAKKMMELKPF